MDMTNRGIRGKEKGTPDVLDRALDRVSGLDFEVPNRFVNHGPMACEALETLGAVDRIDDWVRSFEASMGEAVKPVPPPWGSRFNWADFLGDYRLLPEWMGFFQMAIADDGWEAVVRLWVPRLMPALASALFHGVIRTGHAVRGLQRFDTPSRRAELSRALGNWATWYHPGRPVGATPELRDPAAAVVAAGGRGARHYVASPSIFNLHGVTGAMAVELLIPMLSPSQAESAVAQVVAEHDGLYGDRPAAISGPGDDEWEPAVAAAVSGYDAHEMKLVEACHRGFEASGDPSFALAAQVVTGTRPAASLG